MTLNNQYVLIYEFLFNVHTHDDEIRKYERKNFEIQEKYLIRDKELYSISWMFIRNHSQQMILSDVLCSSMNEFDLYANNITVMYNIFPNLISSYQAETNCRQFFENLHTVMSVNDSLSTSSQHSFREISYYTIF